MKKIHLALISAIFAIPLMGFAVSGAKAGGGSLTFNTAIKSPNWSTVYWYAPDGKRYVFPNEDTYFTWFSSWNNVVTVNDAELATIPVGGNVTFRPGAKLLKVTTDPKVYAVSKGAVLRWVTSESLANALYGPLWRYQVRDIPDTFFTNYVIGGPIYSTADYYVGNEYTSVTWPHESMRSASVGVTGSVTLTADRTMIVSGSSVYLRAVYNGTIPSGARIEIHDLRAGNAVATCYNLNTCGVTVYPTQISGATSVQYRVEVKNSVDGVIASAYGPVIYFSGTPGAYQYDGVNYITRMTLEVDRTSVASGDLIRLTANAYNVGNWNYSGNRIEIRDLRDNGLVKTCYNQSWCVAADVRVTGAVGTTARYETRIYDRNGRFVVSAQSPVIRITSSNAGGGAGSGTVAANASIAFHPTSNYRVGGVVYVNVDVQNANVATRDLITRIYDERSSMPIATCNGSLTCLGAIYTGSSPFSTRVYGVISSTTLSGQVETQRLDLITTN